MATSTRKQVMANLIEEADEIMKCGGDAFSVLGKRYPGMPIEVVTEAWLEASNRETERWWDSVEKTIDGEIIKNALKTK